MPGSNLLLRIEDLVNNPTARVPVCLCLDTSGSMCEAQGDFRATGRQFMSDGKLFNEVVGGTTRIRELQQGVQLFYDAIRADEVAVYAAEVGIVTFDDRASCIMDFANVDRQEVLPQFKARGNTSMGEGVNLALDLLEQRKQEYKDKGVDYYQPWLVLMTDGEPNGNPQELERAMRRTCEAVNAGKLTIFPIGIGQDCDMGVLQRFSPRRQPLHLQGLKFREFFTWLSKSVASTSQSTPGEQVPVDEDGIKSWADL